VPLPLIPWPTGIFKAFKHSSPDPENFKRLKIYLQVQSWAKGSEIEWDVSSTQITTNPPSEIDGNWETPQWKNQVEYDFRPLTHPEIIKPYRTSFQLKLTALISDVRTINVKLPEMKISGTTLNFPSISLEAGTGVGMHFLPAND
jgi:hypothetical protein